MKSKMQYLPGVYLLLGLAGAVLYRCIYGLYLDEISLPLRGTWPEVALWVLTALCFLGAMILGPRLLRKERNRFADGLSHLLLAAGGASLLLVEPQGPAALQIAFRGITAIAAAALVLMALARLLGKKPWFLLELMPCLMGIILLVESLQSWNEIPILLEYVFGIGALLCFVLFCYHRLASGVALPTKGIYGFSGLLGIFFCCCAAMQPDFPLFFVTAALWLMIQTMALGEKPPALEAPAEAPSAEDEGNAAPEA